MIKANDLRVGNLVYVVDKESTPQKQPIQVNLTWMQMLEALEPIPLTPEILEQTGFFSYGSYNQEGDPIKYPFVLEIESGVIHIDSNKAYIYSGLGDNISYGFEANIECLHQLQNLFYSLTGTELEINLSEKV
jgi:hypothetical protein